MNLFGLNISTKGRMERKAVQQQADLRDQLMPIIQSWYRPPMGQDQSFLKLGREGFKKNSAVAAVTTAWTLAMQEPPPQVVNAKGEPQPDSELQKLLDHPNPEMDFADLMMHVTFYRCISGNAYLYLVTDGYGDVVEIWPYSDAHITPIPGRLNWIESYRFNNGDDKFTVDPSQIIHLKWFNPNLEKLWMAEGPLTSLLTEVKADTELSQFVYTLLFNDAFPRTALMVPPSPNGQPMPEGKRDEMKEKFKERFGGQNRGEPIVLQGVDIKRLSMNLQELEADFLRNGPESRICSVYRTPIEVIQFYAGIQKSTYNNKENAQKFWMENTVASLLAKDGSAMTRKLGPRYGDGLKVQFDLTKVISLRSNQMELDKATREDVKLGIASIEEARAKLKYGEIDPSHKFAQSGKVTVVTNGDV